MRAGTFDRTVELQRSVETVDAATTAPVQTWSTIATLRAELVDLASVANAAIFGTIETTDLVLRIYYRTDLTSADRIVFAGQPFKIKGIVEIGRRRGLELQCERTP